MKEISEVVVTLESKVNLLVEELQGKLKVRNAEVLHLEGKYQRTKVASALSGSDEGVRETKLKINRLVREIDGCIALMQG